MGYTLTNTLLCLDKVSMGYPDKDDDTKINFILKDINLVEKDVHRDNVSATGQIIAFLGRSGRGKSTLFRGLTGLLAPVSGNILINDLGSSDVDDAKVVCEGDVGFVDQTYTLFRHKTVFQCLKYALRKKDNITDAEKNELIDQYLNDWGLTEHKDKYPCELSGGQRQRTAIIEQLLTSKYFMVFDEPFSGLDVGNVEKVKESFTKILSTNTLNTIIFSTHDIELAVELADSIYIIGHPEGVKDYSTIIKHYDLKSMGIAWTQYGEPHRILLAEIKNLLLQS
jgi:ABC-type nitrate/sulfonate/bicarbonate transport system ATPase subunit